MGLLKDMFSTGKEMASNAANAALAKATKWAIVGDVISLIGKILGKKIKECINGYIAKASSIDISFIPDSWSEGLGNILAGFVKIVTAPIALVGNVFGFIGYFFIPCLILTIILIIVQFLMKLRKKRKVSAKQASFAKAQESARDPSGFSKSDAFN